MKRVPLETVTDCKDCGACCSEMRSPPFVGSYLDGRFVPSDPKDRYGDHAKLMAAPEEARQVFIEGLLSDRPNESPCSWFDPVTKQCRWYKFRPDVCRNSLDVAAQSRHYPRESFAWSMEEWSRHEAAALLRSDLGYLPAKVHASARRAMRALLVVRAPQAAS